MDNKLERIAALQKECKTLYGEGILYGIGHDYVHLSDGYFLEMLDDYKVEDHNGGMFPYELSAEKHGTKFICLLKELPQEKRPT